MEAQERPSPLRICEYLSVRDLIHTGHLAFFVGDGPIARVIQHKTGSPYSHVGMCGWEAEGRVLLLGESTRPESRVVTLSSQIALHPGAVDIWRLRPEIAEHVDFCDAWEWILRATGIDYPESELLDDWKYLSGFNPKPTPNSDSPEFRRVCSHCIHAALRVNGMPPIREYDCRVFPCTLTEACTYCFTLR